MKRFLVILVASMFLGSVAARAAQAQDTKGTVAPSRAETEDRKVGFVGEQKTGEKAKKSDTKGTVAPSRAETEDRKVGFTGEQKTPDQK